MITLTKILIAFMVLQVLFDIGLCIQVTNHSYQMKNLNDNNQRTQTEVTHILNRISPTWEKDSSGIWHIISGIYDPQGLIPGDTTRLYDSSLAPLAAYDPRPMRAPDTATNDFWFTHSEIKKKPKHKHIKNIGTRFWMGSGPNDSVPGNGTYDPRPMGWDNGDSIPSHIDSVIFKMYLDDGLSYVIWQDEVVNGQTHENNFTFTRAGAWWAFTDDSGRSHPLSWSNPNHPPGKGWDTIYIKPPYSQMILAGSKKGQH
jgi:hypothetical protein